MNARGQTSSGGGLPAAAAAAQHPAPLPDTDEMRRKAREQLSSCLEVASVELAKEGCEGVLPASADVGAAVELALYDMQGGWGRLV